MFSQQHILIAEGEVLIAMDLADAVTGLGGLVIGPVATVREALELLDCQRIAAAILDAKLRDCDITPVVLRLAEDGIPLVVHSATGLPGNVGERWPDLPVLMKPAPAEQVAGRLWVEMQKMGLGEI